MGTRTRLHFRGSDFKVSSLKPLAALASSRGLGSVSNTSTVPTPQLAERVGESDMETHTRLNSAVSAGFESQKNAVGG